MHETEILHVPAERALSPTQIELADFVLNPYRGCSVGCLYCYARMNKGIRKIAKEWGRFVYVKEQFVDRLEEEIARQNVIRQVLIGSTTEPFQKAEEEFHITRDTLRLLKSKKIPVIVLTKSPLVADYADLLGYSPDNRVYITVNSEPVRELFEKDSAPQQDRLNAIKKLSKAGVPVVAYISPVFPLMTDMNSIMDSLTDVEGSFKVHLETYNPKMGNWPEIRNALPDSSRAVYDRIFSSKEEYDNFWSCFLEETLKLNLKHGLKIEFHVNPFDSFYRS